MSDARQHNPNSPTLDAVPAPPALAAAEPTLAPAAAMTGIVPASAPAGYELLEELGRGAMGVVYKARQVHLNRLVALKMILAGAHAGPHELARFRGEAEAVARLRHPHIVQIYEIGEAEGRPYFSLEYIEGGSLADRLDGTPQPPRRAAQLVQALAGGVEAAHQQGIIHRDLKPANILLSGERGAGSAEREELPTPRSALPAPKITDFGLAKRLGDGAGPTQSGAILGTPSYMAPEQAGGQGKSVGPAADVYALGAILYELLTGRPPFKAATPLDTVLQVMSAEPVPPSRLQPKLPRDLETICLKCLQKEPRKRYESAAALADDLQRFLADEPILARPARWWERAGKWARRRPAAAALLGVSLAALIALLVVGLMYQARLERSLAALTQEKEKTDREKEKADREHERAQAHLHKALTAVDEIAKLGIEGLAENPQFADLRRRLAETALTLHRGFLQLDGDEPAVRSMTARAYTQTAGLYLILGKTAEAEPACREAIQLQEQLVADFPDQAAHRHDLSTSHSYLAHVYAIQGHTDRAIAEYRQALALSEQLVDREPHKADYQVSRANNNLSLGYFYTFAAPDRGEKSFQEAIRIAKHLIQAHPQVADYRWLLAGGYSSLGWARNFKGKPDAAEPLLDQALTILLPGGAEVAGAGREYQEFLCQTWANLGHVYLKTGRPEQARKSLALGVAGYERLLARTPTHVPYRIFLMYACQQQGELYDQTKEPILAVEAWRKASAFAGQLAEENPKGFWLGMTASDFRIRYLLALLRHGDVDRALALTEEFVKQKNLAPVMCYNLACIYAVASAAVASDSERAEELARRAMNWLGKAEQAGFLRNAAALDHARKDEDLHALRQRADFQELMKRAETEVKTSKPRPGAP
jgi:serine/threonine-protein kinase